MAGASKVAVKLERRRLDRAGVQAHFEALAEQASEIEVRVKGAAADHSSAATGEPLDAARRLLAGEISAVQVRFWLEDAWWCDTVMRAGDAFRLVRMRQS